MIPWVRKRGHHNTRVLDYVCANNVLNRRRHHLLVVALASIHDPAALNHVLHMFLKPSQYVIVRHLRLHSSTIALQ